MIRILRTSQHTLCIILLVTWSAGLSERPTAAAPRNISWEIDAESRFVGDADVRGGDTTIHSFTELTTDLKGVLSMQVSPDLLLHFGAEWQRLSFDVPDRAEVPSELQKVCTIIGLDYQLSDRWLLRAELAPGLYSDLHDVSWRDVDPPFLIGAAYLANADLQWVVGLRLDLRSRYPALPALGLRWKFADQWTLNLLFPQPRLEWEWSDRMMAYFGAGLEFGTFTVSDHFGGDRGRSDLNGAALDYSEIRVGPGLSWRIRPKLTVEAEAGYTVYRRFDYFDEHLLLRSDPAPYVQVAAHIQF